MHRPIFVRELSDPERAQLEASLRALSAFTLRRAQILLASAAGHRPREIARHLGCASQTVRNAIHAFNATGLAALSAGSSRPKSAVPVLNGAKLEQLRALVHHSPRAFGLARSTWTLALLARVAHEQGLSPTVLSIETIRQALRRLKLRWRRAKHWLTSPDPAYARKKSTRPADPTGREPTGLDARVRGRGLVLASGATGPACLGGGAAACGCPCCRAP
jgi:transposase